MNKELTLEAYQNLLVTYAEKCKEFALKGDINSYKLAIVHMNQVCDAIFELLKPKEKKEKKNDKKSK